MRPWMIVLSAVIAAICVVAVIVRSDLGGMPFDGLVPLLLQRLPALALAAIAVYALVAVIATAGGLIAEAVDLRRRLGRIDAGRQPAALDWIEAFAGSALRALVPRPVATLPKSAERSMTILLGDRFDPRAAQAAAAHVFYIWLARTHALAAFVALAAIAGLGFAQGQGGAPFLPVNIPIGSTVLVLLGLLVLLVFARLAIDVAVDPLIDAMSRLPWERTDMAGLRYAVGLLETARIDAAAPSRGVPNEASERLAVALEDGNRALAAIGERLSATTDRLTAELRQGAVVERGAGAFEEERRALAAAVERLSAAADAVGAAARSSSDAVAAALRETRSLARDGGEAGGVGVAALQAAVEGLTAELRQGAAAERGAGAFEEERRVLAATVARLSAAADAVGAAARSSSDGVAAAVREAAAHAATEPGPSSEARAAVGAAPVRPAPVRPTADLGRELQKLLAEM